MCPDRVDVDGRHVPLNQLAAVAQQPLSRQGRLDPRDFRGVKTDQRGVARVLVSIELHFCIAQLFRQAGLQLLIDERPGNRAAVGLRAAGEHAGAIAQEVIVRVSRRPVEHQRLLARNAGRERAVDRDYSVSAAGERSAEGFRPIDCIGNRAGPVDGLGAAGHVGIAEPLGIDVDVARAAQVRAGCYRHVVRLEQVGLRIDIVDRDGATCKGVGPCAQGVGVAVEIDAGTRRQVQVAISLQQRVGGHSDGVVRPNVDHGLGNGNGCSAVGFGADGGRDVTRAARADVDRANAFDLRRGTNIHAGSHAVGADGGVRTGSRQGTARGQRDLVMGHDVVERGQAQVPSGDGKAPHLKQRPRTDVDVGVQPDDGRAASAGSRYEAAGHALDVGLSLPGLEHMVGGQDQDFLGPHLHIRAHARIDGGVDVVVAGGATAGQGATGYGGLGRVEGGGVLCIDAQRARAVDDADGFPLRGVRKVFGRQVQAGRGTEVLVACADVAAAGGASALVDGLAAAHGAQALIGGVVGVRADQKDRQNVVRSQRDVAVGNAIHNGGVGDADAARVAGHGCTGEHAATACDCHGDVIVVSQGCDREACTGELNARAQVGRRQRIRLRPGRCNTCRNQADSVAVGIGFLLRIRLRKHRRGAANRERGVVRHKGLNCALAGRCAVGGRGGSRSNADQGACRARGLGEGRVAQRRQDLQRRDGQASRGDGAACIRVDGRRRGGRRVGYADRKAASSHAKRKRFGARLCASQNRDAVARGDSQGACVRLDDRRGDGRGHRTAASQNATGDGVAFCFGEIDRFRLDGQVGRTRDAASDIGAHSAIGRGVGLAGANRHKAASCANGLGVRHIDRLALNVDVAFGIEDSTRARIRLEQRIDARRGTGTCTRRTNGRSQRGCKGHRGDLVGRAGINRDAAVGRSHFGIVDVSLDVAADRVIGQ